MFVQLVCKLQRKCRVWNTNTVLLLLFGEAVTDLSLGPPYRLLKEYLGYLQLGPKLIADLNLLLSLRIHGNVPLLLHMPSWRKTELSTMQALRFFFPHSENHTVRTERRVLEAVHIITAV